MIGRTKEIDLLKKALTSKRPELIAVIGRRRVGKTYLIRTFFKDRIDFEMVGLRDGNMEQQLRNFAYSLKEAKRQIRTVKTCSMKATFSEKEIDDVIDKLKGL